MARPLRLRRRRDLDTAEQLTEQALSITKQRRPLFEFLALLDLAGIWAARGQAREALATVEAEAPGVSRDHPRQGDEISRTAPTG